MTYRYLLRTALAVALALSALAPAAHAQLVDNKGTDFVLAFLPNQDGSTSPNVELHLTADAPTSVTVQYPVNAPTFDVTVAVNPGAITVVSLPTAAAQAWAGTAGTVFNNGVRAFAPEEFVAYMINRQQATSDAALALPVDALNTEYISQNYTPRFSPSEFVVVAAFDDTEVTITPAAALRGVPRPADVPFTITLDRGEGFAALSQITNGGGGDLTGSLIEADKPVAVTNGDGCPQIPPGTTFCDHIFEVAQPTVSWGLSALVSPLANRTRGSVYRVLASEDDTTVEQDGVVVDVLDKGEFYDTGVITGAHEFSADKPIFVTQFMTGDGFFGSTGGDPAQGNLVPTDQYLPAYTFATVGDNQFDSHFANIIALDADAAGGLLLLDGAPVPATAFTPIGATGYSWARLSLPEGTHTTTSPNPHGLVISGYTNVDSYMYPGGARFQLINAGNDDTPPECSGSVAASVFNGTATDTPAADPDNRGIFFVVLEAGSTNLVLDVDPFTPGDPSVTYTVSLDDPTMDGDGSVLVTDGAGNTCSSPVALQGAGGTTDQTPPVCGPLAFDMSGNGSVFSTVSDPESGIASVEFTHLRNLGGFVDGAGPFAVGDTYVVPGTPMDIELRGTRIDPTVRRAGLLAIVTNGDGLTSTCDPVVAELSASSDATALLAPAPNPMRGTSRLAFALAESGPVRLAVYDAVGREVARLVDETMSQGTYSVTWDATDPVGRMLSSGVYVVRLVAGPTVHTQTITVVR